MNGFVRTLIPLTALLAAGLTLPRAVSAQNPARHASQQDRLLVSAAESRSKGSESAAVLVYEIADFQCPHCARFATEVFPQIDSAYIRTGLVQWVFVNLPMPSHMNAWVAAEAALCAGAIGGSFWKLHDKLFARVAEWSAADAPGTVIGTYARDAGVPMDRFRACVAEDLMAPLILQDVIFGSRVTGTPTFLVNDERTIVGVKSFDEWREILEPMLRRRQTPR